MPNKSINKISSYEGQAMKNIFCLSLCLCLCFSLLVIVASSVPVCAANSGSASGATFSGGSGSVSISNVNNESTSTIVQNARKKFSGPDSKPMALEPIADPGGGGSSDGPSRAMQAVIEPPTETPVTVLVPPIPVIYSQSVQMAVAGGEDSTNAAKHANPAYKGSGLPATATEVKMEKIAAAEDLANRLKAPDLWTDSMLAAGQAGAKSLSNSIGAAVQGPPGTGGGGGAFGSALASIAGTGSGGAGGASGGDGGEMDSFLGAISGMPSMGLINVANEAAGIPSVSFLPFKTIPQAVWMVQQMYKHFSIPLAILLLLPGAVITQVKAQVTSSFNLKGEDATSPFEGILRSVIAIFLIPATQLIVSYSIDVGNSMAYSVNPAVGVMPILGWLQQVAYTTLPSNEQNAILPPNEGGNQLESSGSDGGGPFLSGGPLSGILGGGLGGLGGNSMGGGLAAGESDDQSRPEGESNLSTTLETMFNVMMYMFSIGMLVMTAFQLVIMCYLYLLGPIAAAFFAWPSVRGKLFRSVFGNWTNAVITVSLWRFYWMVILAIMTNRLLNLGENGSMLFNLQWEVAIFTCLIGLLFYAPMRPWDFDPGQAYRSVKFFGESIMQAGAAAGGGGGGSPSGGANKSSSGADHGGNNTNKNNGGNNNNNSSSNTNKGGESNKSTVNASAPPSTESNRTSAMVAQTEGAPVPQQQGAASGNEPAKGEASPRGGQPQLALNNPPTSSQNAGSGDRAQPNSNQGQTPPPPNQGGMSLGAGQNAGQSGVSAGSSSPSSQSSSGQRSNSSEQSSANNRMPLQLNPNSPDQGNSAGTVTPNPNVTPEKANEGMKDYQPAQEAMKEANLPPANADNSTATPPPLPPPPPNT